jgi:hypothetical protein
MSTVYYTMSYGEYKKHAHRLHGGFVVGHSVDAPMTDDSEVLLKVIHEEHIHLYLEQQENVHVVPKEDSLIKIHAGVHPIMKDRR